MVRFATIGSNFIVEWFLSEAKECSNLQYVAAYSRNQERAEQFAGDHGAQRGCADLEELAKADDIDAVYIASPNSLHCEQAVMMLEHGKHVLCEKPIASNAAELKKMAAAAKENNVVLMEAMRSIHTPGFKAIEQNLPKLGTLRRATFQFCQYSSRYDRFKEGIIENAFRPELGGGALKDIGVYCVHAMVRLFGRPKKLLTESIILENGIDGAGTILAEYQGMLAELIYSKITNSRVPSQIQGEDACMVIDKIQNPRRITIYFNDGRTEEINLPGEGPDMIYEIQEWARLIENRKLKDSWMESSLMAMMVMDEVSGKGKAASD